MEELKQEFEKLFIKLQNKDGKCVKRIDARIIYTPEVILEWIKSKLPKEVEIKNRNGWNYCTECANPLHNFPFYCSNCGSKIKWS